MTDTREKLEADIRKLYSHSTTTLMYPPSANKTTDYIRAVSVDTVLGWLDRQSAITERECLVQSVQGADAILTAENAELQAKVDELQEKLRYETIACGKAVRNMQDKVNELTAENERLRNHQEKVECDCDCCKWQEEREELQARLESAHKDWLVDVGEYERIVDGMKKQIAELLEQVDELQSRLEAQERETACQSTDMTELIETRYELHPPKAADMVAVVRCRDCVRFYEGEPECSTDDWCSEFSCQIEPDGFCAWAERREQ